MIVCQGDAEAAQPRRTRWSRRAHQEEEMLGKECKEVGAGCFQPAFILCFSHKLIFEGASVIRRASGCSFCPKFSDDVHPVSADAHFPFSGRSFREKCVSGELRGNEA